MIFKSAMTKGFPWLIEHKDGHSAASEVFDGRTPGSVCRMNGVRVIGLTCLISSGPPVSSVLLVMPDL